jgi:hypothetical protein
MPVDVISEVTFGLQQSTRKPNTMKISLSSASITSVVVALITILFIGTSAAAGKQKPSTENEFPFDQVGTVTKHGVDTCMVGVNYELHSNVKAPLHKTTNWLAAVSESDKAILDKATKDGGLVRVKGTMMISVKNCKWVKVSSVTPVKKSPENKP